MKNAKVYFVGAGPGDPTLMTVKGAMLIEQAECIIYDGLANPDLLDGIGSEVEAICVAKRSGCHSYTQPEINQLICEKAKQYSILVRLKGGDPCLFGRAAEEIKTCIDAGVDFEIVPGITAGMAAAEYAGVFLTDREHTSAVCFLTGREAEGKEGTDLDWDNLAGFHGSLVIYMGMGNLAKIADTLIAKGKSPDTPVAVVHQATRPEQRVVKSTLSVIADRCAEKNVGAPSIVIVGQAAKGIDGADWFAHRPLAGKKIIITRDESGNRIFAENLRVWGACPVRFDSIEIMSLAASHPVQDAIKNMRSYDWAIFTSANGIRHTFAALNAMGLDARAFADTKIACIGGQTASELCRYGLNADFVPQTYTSTALAEGLIEKNDLSGKSILLLRSEIAPDDLPEALIAGDAKVTDVPVYTTCPKKAEQEAVDSLLNDFGSNRVDWITFTSSSTVDSFFSQIDKEYVQRSSVKIASIGPFTTIQLKKYGIAPDVKARIHTVQGLITAMARTHHD